MDNLVENTLTDSEMLEFKHDYEVMDVKAEQLLEDHKTIGQYIEATEKKPIPPLGLEMIYISVNTILKRHHIEVTSLESNLVKQQILPEYLKTIQVTLESRLSAIFGEIIDSSSLMVKELMSGQKGNCNTCIKLNDGVKLGKFEMNREFAKPVQLRNLSTLEWEDENELMDLLRDALDVFKSIDTFKSKKGDEHLFADEIFGNLNGFEKVKGTERLSIFGLSLIKTNGYETIRLPPNKNQKVYKPLSEDGVAEITNIVIEMATKFNKIEDSIIRLGKYAKSIDKVDSDQIVLTNIKNTLKTLHALLAIKGSIVSECTKLVKLSVNIPKKDKNSSEYGEREPTSSRFVSALNGGKDGNILGSILGTSFL